MTKQLFASLLVLVVFAAGTAKATLLKTPPSEVAAAGTASAAYNYATGEFYFNIGTGVSIVGIQADGLVKNSGNSPTLSGKAPGQFDNSVLAYFDFSAPLPSGIFNQGAIFDSGMAGVDLVAGIATPIGFSYQAGGVDVVVPVDVIRDIPEPATLGMMGLALVGATFIRRR